MRFERREREPGDVHRWLVLVVALLLIGAGLALLQRWGVRTCLVHRLTGYPCLTCGSSRAASLLIAGHPWDAFCQQPLAVAFGGAWGLWLGFWSIALLAWRRHVRIVCSRGERLAALVTLAVLAAGNWAYLLWRGV